VLRKQVNPFASPGLDIESKKAIRAFPISVYTIRPALAVVSICVSRI